jgi:hypothetical protein
MSFYHKVPQGYHKVPQGNYKDTPSDHDVSQGYPNNNLRYPGGIPGVLDHAYLRYHKESLEYSAMST